MTSSMNGSNRTQRKTLAAQIDRLDEILTGLGDKLNDSIALSMKDVVSEVVREAVQTAVREVLSSPDLLRAALARHEPEAAAEQPDPTEPKNNSMSMWRWLGGKASDLWASTRQSLSFTWFGLLSVIAIMGNWAQQRCFVLAGCAAIVWTALLMVGLGMWRFRRSCAIAVGVGVMAGVIGYLVGPVIASAMCGLGGAMLAVSAMVLVPLGRLLLTEDVGNA